MSRIVISVGLGTRDSDHQRSEGRDTGFQAGFCETEMTS
jgi:hypothetical protein